MVTINIKMPNSCSECVLNYDSYCCIVTNTKFWGNHLPSDFDSFERRLPNCPLVEVEMEKN